MKPSSLNWFDVIHIPVLTFKEGESGFAIGVTRPDLLQIWVTVPGESRPSRLMTLAADGHVLSGELGPMPGDRGPQRMTAEQLETWGRTHKAFSSADRATPIPPHGDEFKAFWEEQASKALAAIRGQMAN